MRPALPGPCLCLVTDRHVGDERTLVSRVAQAVAGGVDMLQLREKDLPGGRLLELAEALKKAIGDSALLVVNERVDVAAAVAADGVQLGEEALPVAVARDILGPEALIGRSVHSLEGAVRAAQQGADFLVVGTIYATRSHPGEEPAGPDLIRRIAAACSVPLIGIGGINASNMSEVMQAGASGAAVITSILAAPDPQLAAWELKQAMLAARPATRGS
jgi:thiamine-phosphate pyrophosphorylase